MVGSAQELEEDVKVTLVRTPTRHSGLLKQVPVDRRSSNRANGVEEDANELALRTVRAC